MFIRAVTYLCAISALRYVCASALAVLTASAAAQVCPFDDGHSTLAVEGVILTRYALGLTGAPLVASTSIAAADAPTVEGNINCPSCGLNLTGNATMTVADATIISRKLAGFAGDALTNGLALGSGTRNTPAAVQSFLLAGCGATGGTVTSITAGTGLTGGTITGAGTLAADTNYLQRRVNASCAAGSSIRVINADGSVICQIDAVGSNSSGTVTSVSAGNGLIATGANVVAGAIVTNGSMALATAFALPQSCASGQVPKSDGAGVWACGTDDTATAASNAFVQGGNAFGVPAVLGTTDGQPLTLGIGGGAGVRILPSSTAGEPNIIGGHPDNRVSSTAVKGAFVGGGGATGALANTVAANYGTIGGGADNQIIGEFGTIGGGAGNRARGSSISGQPIAATIAGGRGNQANGEAAAIGGGGYNLVNVTSEYGTIAGGSSNAAYGAATTVGGGQSNYAIGNYGTVSGGFNNFASGEYSSVPGGKANYANGRFSFAAGQFATAGDGTFVWNTYTSGNNLPTRTDSFRVQSPNGFDVAFGLNREYFVAINADTAGFIITTSTGAKLSAGGVWTNNSDRTKKRDFSPINAQNAQDILRKVVALPLSTWSYFAEDAKIRHIGPMAQDFWKAFGLGYDDKTMTDIDARGVTLAAIQGLNQIVKAKDAEIAGLRNAHREMQRELAAIKRKIGM